MSSHERGGQGGPYTEKQGGDGRPRQELILQTGTDKRRQGADTATTFLLTEQEAFYRDFWDRFIEKASIAPSGEDPAFWPIRMLADFEHIIAERETISNPARREVGEKLAPIKDSIRHIRAAYEITAHP